MYRPSHRPSFRLRMFPSPFARRFGMVSTPFATNNTVTNRGKLSNGGTAIRKLSFEFGGTSLPYLCLLRRNSCAAGGYASLVTAVRFSNGQEALSIDYSGAKYACLALPVLRDVITSVFSKNGHKAPPKSLGHLRLREPRRQPL